MKTMDNELIELAKGACSYAKHTFKGFPVFAGLEHKSCLLSAFFACQHLSSMGIPCRMVGGSATWRMLTLEECGEHVLAGNDKFAEHFGYIFNENHDYMEYVNDGELPEMHVWTSILHNEEEYILDPTVGYQITQMEELTGIKHTGKPLPEWLLGKREDLGKKDYNYDEDTVATRLAYNLVNQFMLQTIIRRM